VNIEGDLRMSFWVELDPGQKLREFQKFLAG
jgi:hypothetical protein